MKDILYLVRRIGHSCTPAFATILRILCAAVSFSQCAYSQNLSALDSLSFRPTPFSFGLSGGISRQFPLNSLARLPISEPFPALLEIHNGTTFEGGLEVLYRLSTAWEFGLRGQYTQFSATTRGEGSTLIAVPNPQGSLPIPTRFPVQVTLLTDVRLISFTPLIRLFVGEFFFVSAGVRVDIPLLGQTLLRTQFDLIAPPAITYVVSSTQRLESAWADSLARVGFSWSPVISLGASLPIGRVRVIPEIQIQPIFQPFRGFARDGFVWNLPSVRLNVGLILSFPETLSSKNNDTVQKETPIALSPSTASQLRTTTIGENTPPPQVILSETHPETHIDTVFQRDTTTRFVPWQDADTIHLEQTSIERRSIPSGEQISITESYKHDIPKPKPFLVANMDVRFVPSLGAMKSLESKQAAKLTEKPMIVHSFFTPPLMSPLLQSWTEKYDTVASVRLPIIRFLPSVSSEVGVKMHSITIRSEGDATAHNAQLYQAEVKPLDWDAQALVFPFVLKNFPGAAPTLLADSNTSSANIGVQDTLWAWMNVTDNETQSRATDTARITVERFEAKDQVFAMTTLKSSPRQTEHWTIAHLRLIQTRSGTNTTFALAPESVLLLKNLSKELYGNAKKQKALSLHTSSVKNCTVYADITEELDANSLEQLQSLVRFVAGTLQTTSYHILRHTSALPADTYIRVMVEH